MPAGFAAGLLSVEMSKFIAGIFYSRSFSVTKKNDENSQQCKEKSIVLDNVRWYNEEKVSLLQSEAETVKPGESRQKGAGGL